MPKINLPVKNIVTDYKNGLSSLMIAKKYGTSKKVILSRLKESGVKRRNLSDACRKNNLDIYFFDKIDSEEKAYWLGFLLADGNIQPCGRFNKGRMIRVALQERDKNHLIKYFNSLRSSHRLIHNYKLKSVWAKFTSIPLAKALEEKGWHEFKKKGNVRILKEVPIELRKHLLRGLIDGDGCIAKRKGRKNPWIIQFVDLHKSVVRWVKSELLKLGLNGKAKITQHKHNRSWHFYFGNSTVPFLLKNIYENSTVFLDRKKELSMQAISSILLQK